MELRKCPFCGGEAEMMENGMGLFRVYHFCEILNGFLETNWFYGEEEAAARWNAREEL